MFFWLRYSIPRTGVKGEPPREDSAEIVSKTHTLPQTSVPALSILRFKGSSPKYHALAYLEGCDRGDGARFT